MTLTNHPKSRNTAKKTNIALSVVIMLDLKTMLKVTKIVKQTPTNRYSYHFISLKNLFIFSISPSYIVIGTFGFPVSVKSLNPIPDLR